ncbi:MAG: hypothetical protein ACOZB1_03105, partial [Pseudomonadota bacterium]
GETRHGRGFAAHPTGRRGLGAGAPGRSRPTLIPPYEQVRATLRQALLAQATAAASRDFVAELMKRARIEFIEPSVQP